MSAFEIKSNIHLLIDKVQDEELLVKIEEILQGFMFDKSLGLNSLPPELESRLEKSEKDAETGNVIQHDEIINRFRKQYSHFYES